MLEIEQAKLAAFLVESEFQFAAVEHGTILITEHRDQHLPLQFAFEGFPVDVEIASVGRGSTVFQDIEPPGIVLAQDAHVIGNDVENLAHAMFVKGVHEALVIFGAADFWIELMMVDDVIAMHAPGPCP